MGHILFGGDADDRLKRADNLRFRHLAVRHGNLAALNAARGLDDDVRARGNLFALRVEIINFANVFKTNANYFCHW